MVIIGERLDAATREDWRAWLEAHHHDSPEIWLTIARKGAENQLIPLADAVEEALCFGWIDSFMKPIDPTCFFLRFSPRRKKASHWAASNRERALRLLRHGKMAPAGIAALPDDLRLEWEAEQAKKEQT